jgi:hypothetical protein
MGLLIVTVTDTATATVCGNPIGGHHRGTMVVAEPGCTSVTVKVNVCDGACSSISYPYYENGEVQTGMLCHGCEASSVKTRSVRLKCGSENKDVEYYEPDECWCKLYKCETGLKKRRFTNETRMMDAKSVEAKGQP